MAITNATITTGSSKTISKMKADNNAVSDLSYVGGVNSETNMTALAAGNFYSDVKVIDASAIAAKASLNANLTGANLTSFTGGKGNDTILAYEGVGVINGGAGKDLFVISDTSKSAVIGDYASGQDTIQVAGNLKAEFDTYDFVGKNVKLTLSDSTNDSVKTSVTINNAKGNLVTIVDSTGKVVFDQSFQVGGQESYEVTDKNTGSELYSSAKYIDASGRGKDLVINATSTEYAQLIDGGKKSDTFNISYSDTGYSTITTGNGNDTINVVKGNHLIITDYQGGNAKENIQIADGLAYYDYRISGNDVILQFSDTNLKQINDNYGDGTGTFNPKKDDPAASVVVKNLLWDQTAKTLKKSLITVTDSKGATVAGTGVYQDPTILYVGKVGKDETIADLTKDSVVGTGFKLDSDTVDSIVFTAGTAMSIKAGGGYAAVTGGGGKDTLLGGDDAFDEAKADPTSDSARTRNDMTVVASPYNNSGSVTTVPLTITGRYGDAHMTVTYTYDSSVGENRITKLEDTDDSSHSDSVAETSNGSASLTVGKYYLQLKNLYNYSFSASMGNEGEVNAVLGKVASDIADVINATGYKYVYDISQTTLNGGKGNDYLYGNTSGGRLYGDVGNDTLRGGNQVNGSTPIDEDDLSKGYVQIGGNAYMEGGAGNDTFLLTGEGPATIGDYNSGLTRFDETDADGKKDAANRKKELGSDVITIQYDKYNKNNLNNTYLGRASLNSSEWVTALADDTVVSKDTDGYGYLRFNVSGQAWVPTHTVVAGENQSTVIGEFSEDITDKGEYYIKVKDGDQITIQEQGQKYTQYVDFSRSTEVTVAGNYLGLANPDAVKIDATNSKKAARIVAGINTTEIVGSAKNDTLIGNTSGQNNYTVTGGAGNDVFVVDSSNGDNVVITDYDGLNLNKLGKDKIQVESIYDLAQEQGEEKNVQEITTAANISNGIYSYGLKDNDGNETNVTIKVKVETEGFDPKKYSYNEATGEYSVDNTNGKYVYVEEVNVEGSLNQANYAIKSDTYVKFDSDAESAIRTLVNKTTYVTEVEAPLFENKIVGDDVHIGGMVIKGAAAKVNNKLQAITFQQMDEVVSYDKKTGEASGSKNVVSTMIRSFSADKTDSIVSGGASNYLEIFSGDIDSSVVVVKASSKGGTLVNGGDNVNSIVGGGKIDSIVVGHNSNEEITVATGKGNDVIVWDGTQDVVVTDYTAAAYNKKGVFAGDVIQVKGLTFGDDGHSMLKQTDLKYVGDDVIIAYEHNGVTNNLTLTKAKGKAIYVATDTFVAASAVASVDGVSMGGTVGSANLHEYIVDAKSEYAVSNVHTVDANDASYGYTNIINISAGKKASDVQLNEKGYEKVSTLYGGKGNDTINAYNPQYIDGGAGNDVIYLNAGTPANNLTVSGGAGNDFLMIGSDTKEVQVADYTTTADKLVLEEGFHIVGVSATAGDTITSGKGKNATTITSSDVTIAVTDGKHTGTVTLKTLAPDTKITRSADGTAGKAYYSLDYLAKDAIEITAKDFKGAVVNVEGITAKKVQINKAVSVSVEGAAGKTIDADATSKKAIFYIGGTYTTAAANVNFSGGADVYVGNGAEDIVVLGAGNDTVKGDNNHASVVSGTGNNVFFAGKKADYIIDGFTTTDKIFFDAGEDNTEIKSIIANDEKKTLSIGLSVSDTVDGKTVQTYTTVNLTNYTAGQKVTFAALSGNKLVDLAEAHGYTSGAKLEVSDADGAIVTFDGRWNQNVTTVDASARTAKKAVDISVDSTEKVSALIGGKGADTLSAFATNGKVITYTGGDGNDSFIINTGTLATYTITDFKKGDILYTTDTTLFNSITNYSADYSFDGNDVILNGGAGKADVILKDAKGQEITFSNAGTTRKLTLADPVDVVLSKNDTVLSWSAETVNIDRVKTFDASAASAAVTFNGTGKSFTSFKSGSKGATLTVSDKTGAVAITVAGGTNTITLNNANNADTISVNAKSTTTITNFDSNDSIATTTLADIKSATVADADGKRTVDLTLKSGKLTITGATDVFAIKYDNFTAGDAKGGTGDDSDTTKFAFDKIVTIKGIGDYKYGTGTTTEYYKDANAAKDASEVKGDNVKPFIEKYDVEGLVNDFVTGDDISEITSAKVAISADDLKTGLSDTTSEFETKITESSDLTSNKKQE